MMASGVEGWQLRVYHVITRLNLEPQMTNNGQETRGWYTCKNVILDDLYIILFIYHGLWEIMGI